MRALKKQHIIFFLLVGVIFHVAYPKSQEERLQEDRVEEKQYTSPQKFLEDSFTLGKIIFDSGFRPTFLIALWRGGAPIGIAVEEYFSYKKASIDKHISVKTSAYNHNQLKASVEIFNLEYVINNLKRDDALLIVDDIVDSGSTMQKIVEELKIRCGDNMPHDIRIATLYYKPQKASIKPDYYLYETDKWILFPHALEGLTMDEIKEYQGSAVTQILE